MAHIQYPPRTHLNDRWFGIDGDDRGEQFNTLTALFGAFAACTGGVWLVTQAVKHGDPWKITSFAIYVTTLILAFVMATLYHGTRGPAKAIFSKLDHMSIYLLIAGTYTPFTLVTLRDTVGWGVFSLIWGMALIGISLDLLPKQRYRVLPILIYLVMGWLIVVATKPLLISLPIVGFYCLFLGGIFYTIGVVFYVLDHRFRYFHAIWHVFVLAGSFSHYAVILNYVA